MEGIQFDSRPKPNMQTDGQTKNVQHNIELQAVPSEATTKPAPSVDIEAQAIKESSTKDDELYSVFPKPQRYFIVFMTVLGAIISPISGAI